MVYINVCPVPVGPLWIIKHAMHTPLAVHILLVDFPKKQIALVARAFRRVGRYKLGKSLGSDFHALAVPDGRAALHTDHGHLLDPT